MGRLTHNLTGCLWPSNCSLVTENYEKSDFGAKRTLLCASEMDPKALDSISALYRVYYFTDSLIHNLTGCPWPSNCSLVSGNTGKSDFGAKRTLLCTSEMGPEALDGLPRMYRVYNFTDSLLPNLTGCPWPSICSLVSGNNGKSDFGAKRTLLCTSEMGPCLLYTSPSPRDRQKSRMPSSA